MTRSKLDPIPLVDLERAVAWAAHRLDVELDLDACRRAPGRGMLLQAASLLVARELRCAGYSVLAISRALGYSRQWLSRSLAAMPARRARTAA